VRRSRPVFAVKALVLVDLQLEFFSVDGVLGRRHVDERVAETAARLIAAWPAASPVVVVTSVYDRWKTEELTAEHVVPVRSTSVVKPDRLARGHDSSKTVCCERSSPLCALLRCVEAVLQVRAALPGAVTHRVEKSFFSAFVQTPLERILRDSGCTSLVVGGVTTTTCVQATSIDAFRLGFDVQICTDASASSTSAAHCDAVAAVAAMGVWRPVTSGELIRGAAPNPASAVDRFRLVPDVLPAALADAAFEAVRGELPWAHMYHRGIAVSRLVATQAEIAPDGTAPIYRFPSDAQFRPDPWSPTMRLIRDALEATLAQRLNHAKAQLYSERSAHIGPHSDKTLDIEHDSFIVNLSLGATRVFVVQSKTTGLTESVEMRHNSALLFDTRGNQLWTHAVPGCKKAPADLRADELLHGGERISIVFRAIGTYLTADDRLFGQGATVDATPTPVDHSRASTIALLDAFRAQNRQADEFDWQAAYGGGSNVVCLDPAVLDEGASASATPDQQQ
jgi:nicotinamidase-related amidase/alkylated DNA repair dioxygenase AlkB